MLKKILIANRGEIACRIIKTAKKLGIKTVAVYSAADKNALFVKAADEAYLLGNAPASESYLNQAKIIEIAKQSQAQAIHPGYGFLSENGNFAALCEKNNIIFIGPESSAIAAMGDKNRAKEIMQKAGVPIAASYAGDTKDKKALENAAKAIGLPVLVKAAFGGGGRGMRLVKALSELEEAVVSAEREAEKSFANGTVFLEKYIESARHVEVQIFADQLGNVLHLFDRDCSLQRRHQKVIEEASAPDLPISLREKMWQAAITAAKAINYRGAGTIEFLVDASHQFYFMEMNTRLQVEHPVTEMITGLDLVEWQLKVAAGEKLPLAQEQIKQQGHAIEARVCAENPFDDFRPACGKLALLEFPANIRVDTGFAAGCSISPYYDSMIAKIIAYGETRKAAIQALIKALETTFIVGVESNIAFLTRLLKEEDFQNAKLATRFIEDHAEKLTKAPEINDAVLAQAAKAEQERQNQLAFDTAKTDDSSSPWHARDHWRLKKITPRFCFYSNNKKYVAGASVSVTPGADKRPDIKNFFHENQWHIFNAGEHYLLNLAENKKANGEAAATANAFVAPMPGTIAAVLVKPGQNVKAGDKLMVIEAMKMEHAITAPQDGTIKQLFFKAGDTINEGVLLLEMA